MWRPDRHGKGRKYSSSVISCTVTIWGFFPQSTANHCSVNTNRSTAISVSFSGDSHIFLSSCRSLSTSLYLRTRPTSHSLRWTSKLPIFWNTQPRAWFTYIESRFHQRHITDEQVQDDRVLSALPEDMVGQILDLVEAALRPTPTPS